MHAFTLPLHASGGTDGKFPYDSNNPQKRSVGVSVGRRTLGAAETVDRNKSSDSRPIQLFASRKFASQLGTVGIVDENFDSVTTRFGKDFWNRSRRPDDEQGEEFRAW